MNLFLIQSGKKNYIVGMIDLARNNKNTDQLKFPIFSWYGIMDLELKARAQKL